MDTENLVIKFATRDEFDEISRLNHSVFADEIPQHEKKENGLLQDAFHQNNTYVIALLGDQLAGMVCYNAARPFSLDKKMSDLDTYLPPHHNLVEIRLFAVKKELRKQGIAIGMLQFLVPKLIKAGYDLGVISASLKELELYHNIGAKPFGQLVGTKEVPYQPMYFHIGNLKGAFQQ
jgi:predicted N-acetyltransferase YhbS